MADELKTYTGNCHCGAYKYSVAMPELKSIMICDCSICSKKSYKWYFPGQSPFTVVHDGGKLTGYEFGKRSMSHMFCSVCGTGVMGKMHQAHQGMDAGLTARALNDVDLSALEITRYQGKELDPPYIPTKFTGPEPTAEIDGAKIYTGGCHCGAVTLAVKTKSLSELSQSEPGVRECDCSICTRNGTNNFYPRRDQVSIVGESNLTSYLFGDKHHGHKFCKTCGVPIYIDLFTNPGKEVYETWPEERQKMRAMRVQRLAVNVRCLDGVEWDEITVKKTQGSKTEPKYVVE